MSGSKQAAHWENVRLSFTDGQNLPLAEAEPFARKTSLEVSHETARTSAYLDAISGGTNPGGLNAELLDCWREAAGLGSSGVPAVTGHFTRKLPNIAGNPLVSALGSPETPSVTANRSEETVRFSTLTLPPRSIFVHPSPKEEADVVWQSPAAVTVKITGSVADSDGNCGNGIVWRLELIRRGGGVAALASGVMENGASATFPSIEKLDIAAGEQVRLAVDPRNGDHSCDTTRVSLSIAETAASGRSWNLVHDTIDHLQESNPLPDSYGNPSTWHFCSRPLAPVADPLLASDSPLGQWREAVLAKDKSRAEQAALKVEALLNGKTPPSSKAEQALRDRLLDGNGPLRWTARALRQWKPGASDLAVRTTLEIPVSLTAGCELLATAKADVPTEAAVLLTPLASPSPGEEQIQAALKDAPLLTSDSDSARQQLRSALDDFRRLFPAALCYSRIVPADEVITLRLFYREDEPLRRLMLEPREIDDLDRLWRELEFVTQSPLKLVDAFEQLWQYATQDGDPRVLEPLREPILADAARFRRTLEGAEPRQLDAVCDFAAKAWRRPLTEAEIEKLHRLYRTLRADKLEHPEALRLLLARVLTSPAFLYKIEVQPDGPAAAPIDGYALATRLSYFLWSSAPDAELLALARSGELCHPNVLAAQTKRMLADPRVRRLATEFGAQWLHTRGFDELDEKSEKLFPEFAALRASMNEEPIRFITDLFAQDRPVLNLLDADYTFVNGDLARFYGLPVDGGDWQRIEGIRSAGRGGVLGFAATLARQSGASRTSPILRGAWVCETLLGEKLPRPPKNVPVLAEIAPEHLTERQLTEMHTHVEECARCHQRIDPYGFALEEFDTIGRHRTQDAAGLIVDIKTQLADGTPLTGIAGLRNYLLNDRRDAFVRQFCRKLLGYALGRGVILSDAPLLDEMQAELSHNGYRTGVAIDLIVRSRQFREIRGKSYTEPSS